MVSDIVEVIAAYVGLIPQRSSHDYQKRVLPFLEPHVDERRGDIVIVDDVGTVPGRGQRVSHHTVYAPVSSGYEDCGAAEGISHGTSGRIVGPHVEVIQRVAQTAVYPVVPSDFVIAERGRAGVVFPRSVLDEPKVAAEAEVAGRRGCAADQNDGLIRPELVDHSCRHGVEVGRIVVGRVRVVSCGRGLTR